MANGFSKAVDDNHKDAEAYKPKTGYRLTGTETTTQRMTTTVNTGLVRIVSVGAINYSVTTSTTDAVTTSDTYLPANTIEHVKATNGSDRIAFLGSTIVYIMTMQ